MPRVGYNPKNVTIKTDAGTTIDKAHLAHYQIAAADAVAASADGVLGATNLGAEEQEITTGITDPAVPRGLSVVANVSGVTGNVVITGTDFAGADITETFALNGNTPRLGTKAFRSVTSITLPAQVHTPAAQTETIEVTHAVDSEGDGDITLTITSARFDAPVAVVIPVTDDLDDVTKVATAVVAALNADEDVSEYFVVSNEAGVITLTALSPLANDVTLAIAFADTDETGVLMGTGASSEGIPGVPYDIVTVGWSDILGLPYKLAHNTVLATYVNNVLEGNAASVQTSATVLASNTIDPHSALAGTPVDVYLIV